MKTPTPFCCDINSGSAEERNEFKRLFQKVSNLNWRFRYYGINNNGFFDCWNDTKYAWHFFTRIIPLSEGIAILKEMVGEETKQPTDLKVVRDRIVDAVHKSLQWKDGEIGGVDMIQLEQRIDGILDSLQPKP